MPVTGSLPLISIRMAALIPVCLRKCALVARRQIVVRETPWVAGQLERFQPQNGGSGMVPVRAAGLRGKAVDDHVGPELADDAHDVGQYLLPVPDAAAFPGNPWRSQNPWRG